MTIRRQTVEQKDPRLGRQLEHDSRSRRFKLALPKEAVDKSTWKDKRIRVYDPVPNPNQPVGNCTVCAKAMQLNAAGNREPGRVLDMLWAVDAYEWETANDEFPGAWVRDGSGEDTGSSGLASCKTAIHFGVGGEYRWLFNGADGVVSAIMAGLVPSIGTWWLNGMFTPDKDGVIHATGPRVGGHQYVARGYQKRKDLVELRCWWGPGFRDVWMARGELDELILDGGDIHHQKTS